MGNTFILIAFLIVVVALFFRKSPEEKAYRELKESKINKSLKNRYKHIGIESQDDIQKIQNTRVRALLLTNI